MKTEFSLTNPIASLALAACVCCAFSPKAAAQVYSHTTDLVNPNWTIALSDYGYSDYLGDSTPGFEGREYLSGEWGAAVGYETGGMTVSPTWLERQFIYPDWTTNSNFQVDSPIALTGTNSAGLPIAESVISNGDLEITQRFEMIDTVVGTPMGIKPASAAGAGSFVSSNRYVLQQTYTVKNITSDPISNLQLFQLLHGLNAQSGVYDNRSYAGPLSAFQNDVSLNGIDPGSAGASGSSTDGLKDYIGFGSSAVPSAFEIGSYGNEITDNHGVGKPSDGVHLSIENNWKDAPYDGRSGTDSYAPALLWVAGAERWNLGTLAPGASSSLAVVLSIRTGTVLATGTDSSGSGNGGSSHPGGVDCQFDDVNNPGSFFAEYSPADLDELAVRVAEGEFEAINFSLPGTIAQLWNLEFDGEYTGAVHLLFAYDPSLLPLGFDESQLGIYHFDDGEWVFLGGSVDSVNHTISVTSDKLSPFVVGAVPVPEPASWWLSILGGVTIILLRRRNRNCLG